MERGIYGDTKGKPYLTVKEAAIFLDTTPVAIIKIVTALGGVKVLGKYQFNRDKLYNRTETVYFILATNNIMKIWFSRNFEQRFRDIRACNPTIKLIHKVNGNRNYEQNLHKKFDKYKLKGQKEWFIYNKEIKEFIQKLKEHKNDR